MSSPNVLLVMTDEERYPPPYEGGELETFRREQLPARAALLRSGLEFHRHYVASTACAPSRASLFTGQYPSLHGVTSTDGLAKPATGPDITWLDPDAVPTLGDWFRAGGYEAHYRGKWHISHADLTDPETGAGVLANDETGAVDPAGLDAYRRADRLDPFGFSGWIGREPHGADKADCGSVRDGIFADQVVEMFTDLARAGGPWLAVASFVNPHDIAFAGFGWEQLLGLAPPDDTVPDIPEAPSQGDSFADRPPCHEEFVRAWPNLLYAQAPDVAYRRLYYYLHKLVDAAIGRTLDALHDSGMADDTLVVFTSDHGDLLGAHGGLMQKWYNAFDEAVRVPLVLNGPGVRVRPVGIGIPTSHVDLVPTLLGLAGIDLTDAAAAVARDHAETRPLPGRDLSRVITGTTDPADVRAPVYFMTEDDVTRGSAQVNIFTNTRYEAVIHPSKVESVVALLPTGADGTDELWKLVHYYERLDAWHESQGQAIDGTASPAAEPFWELHNLTTDPEERHNLAPKAPPALATMQSTLEEERDKKRLLP